MSVNEKMTAIADAIRDKTGGTDKLSLEAIVTEIPKVYEAGKVQRTDEFWDVVQNYGERTLYTRAFNGWNCEYLRPKYKVVPENSSDCLPNRMFGGNPSLKIIESEYFDLSNMRIYPANETGGNYYTFTLCRKLEVIEDIGLPPSYYSRTFNGCSVLKTIAVLRVQEDTKFGNPFLYCNELENLTIDGVIGQNGFDVSYSTKLSHDSLMSIINALKNYSEDTSGTTWLVTLGSANIAKLTDDELDIMFQKGWTYK